MKKTLKMLRNKAGLTQIDAADVLNVSHDTIARWEGGETYPSALQIAEICRVYRCKFEDIQWPSKN